MKIATIGIKKLATLICDDNRKYYYRTLKDLEQLFYGNLTDIIFDAESLSRKDYCIQAIHKVKKLEKLLKDICDIRNFKAETLQKEFIEELNFILNEDNIKIEKNGIKINVLILDENSFVKNSLTTHSVLSLEYITENIKKAEEKVLNEDYSGAITNSRTLLEQIIRDLCNNYNIKYNDNNLKRNFDSLKKEMNLDPKNYKENGFLEIITGLSKCVNGIFEVRNKCSDGHSRIYNPSKHHAKLCLNSALTISEFLVESYLYQKKKNNKL